MGARLRAVLPILVLALAAAAAPAAGDVLFREEFASLAAWRPLTFPKIARHSTYAVETDAASGATLLRAASDASSSGIVREGAYDVRAWPRLRWRWKVERAIATGDPATKEGDDYAIRVYVVFAYDPKGAPLGRRIRYALAKARTGAYPPDSGLSYVWDGRPQAAPWIPNPYTDDVAVVFKRVGGARVGEWVEEEADVLADYRRIFGKDPPRAAALAVMSDSDDTGGRAVAWVDWIEVSR